MADAQLVAEMYVAAKASLKAMTASKHMTVFYGPYYVVATFGFLERISVG